MSFLLQFIFNFLINSIFMFITVCLLVEFFLFIFRISNYRLRYLFRLTPIFKLFFDLVNYSFFEWAFKDGIDPQIFQKGKRCFEVIAGYSSSKMGLPFIRLGFHLEDGKTFSIADYLFLNLDLTLVNLTLFVVLLISFTLIFKMFWTQRKSNYIALKPFNFNIENQMLLNEIKKRKISLCTLDNIASAYVLRKNIVLPSDILKNFTPFEIEAIIAHEFSHIKWRDNFLLKVIKNIKCFFWYIPGFAFWIKKISLEREYAADQIIKKFEISTFDLANAIKKVAILKNQISENRSYFLESKLKIFNRIKILLKTKNSKTKWFDIVKISSFLLVFLIIAFAKIWLF